jgi:cell division transport system permease protein
MRRGRFFLAEALRSIRSNAAVAVAATTTVAIAVFVLGAFIPSFLFVQSAVDSQKEKIDIRFFVSDAATVDQVDGLQDRLDALQQEGMIEELNFLTKEDALQVMRERLNDPSILEELTGNPFPATYEVKPSDPARAQEIIDRVDDDPALDPDDPYIYEREGADRLLRVASFIQWTGLGLILVLLVASLLLIANTIRLSIFARRREVEVMKLVGGTNWFIRWPFVIEGVICGLLGALAAVALLWAVKVGVVDNWVSDNDPELTRNNAKTISFLVLSSILVAAGAIVGAIGSGLTLRRFLRV